MTLEKLGYTKERKLTTKGKEFVNKIIKSKKTGEVNRIRLKGIMGRTERELYIIDEDILNEIINKQDPSTKEKKKKK